MRSLVTLVLSLLFLFLSTGEASGQDIQLTETIKVDQTANLQSKPKSFCVTEDQIFLIPSPQAGTIAMFTKENDFLKFLTASDRGGFGNIKFLRPTYCLYSKDEGKLGILDYAARKVFILSREGKVEFKTIKTVDCPKLGCDMEFTGDGQNLIVSGYITDKENRDFDLYGINIENGDIDYLLPSHTVYQQKNHDEYIKAYNTKQTIPAIGIKSFFDINGDDLFLVWEGALRIIKFNLTHKEVNKVFGEETSSYTKPDGDILSESYKKGDFITNGQTQEKFSYIRNIFATSRYVFVIYETGKDDKNPVSTFRLQIYTPEGIFLNDCEIPGKPGSSMWLDKDSYELYAFSKLSGTDSTEASILKYKINVK